MRFCITKKDINRLYIKTIEGHLITTNKLFNKRRIEIEHEKTNIKSLQHNQ